MTSPDVRPLHPCRARQIMRSLNPSAFAAAEGESAVFVEEHWDSETDRRTYKLEYRSTFDGSGAVAFCLYNPWGRRGKANAGVANHVGHIFKDGRLCLGSSHPSGPDTSSMDLETTVRRARYWCTAFSVLKETGAFPDH